MDSIKNTQYITLDEIVKQYSIDVGDPNNNKYNSYFNWAQRALTELEWDILQKFKYVFLPVDPATKRVKLPDDFLQYTRVGFQNQVKEIIDLTYDPNLAFAIDSTPCHCDECGCHDEVCYAISNTELTTQEVTLPTNVKRCNYSIDFTALSFPYSVNYVVKSTGNFNIGVTVTDAADLDAVMVTDLGWTKTGTGNYDVLSQNFIWTQFDLTVASVETQWFINETGCMVDIENISYTNTTKTCVSAKGDIYQENCTWGFVTHSQTCNYYLALSGGAQPLVFPFTNVRYIVNGATISVANITSYNALNSFFNGLGFATLSNSQTTANWRINQTTDSYTIFEYNDGNGALHFNTFGKDACISTTVNIGCADNTVCSTTIKPCGCLVMTDQVINTLYNAGLVNNTMFERWVHGGDISNLYRQPLNLYGFYNIDTYQGIIQLDPFFRFNTIYLEYYATSVVDTKDYLVPIFARDYFLSYIHKMSLLRKPNASPTLIEMAKKQNRADKHNLKLRISPPRAKQLLDLLSNTPPFG